MSVATKNDIDPSHPGRHFQIHIHAVMRKHHNHLRPFGSDLVDHRLALFIANAKAPILHHVARVGDRGVRKGLADNSDRDAVHLTHAVGLEHPPGILVKGRLTLKGRVLGQHNILCQKLDRGQFALNNLANPIHPIGELPVSSHDVNAQQLAGINHILALGPQRSCRSLPGITAIE